MLAQFIFKAKKSNRNRVGLTARPSLPSILVGLFRFKSMEDSINA